MVSNQWPMKIERGLIQTEIKSSMFFVNDKKIGRQLAPLSGAYFPKRHQVKIWFIWFSIFQRSNSYDLKDEMTP